MNRKLFNGLLLLTVATGGVGTFTSCKDTEQDFRNDVEITQTDLSNQIQRLRDLTDLTFKNNLDKEIQKLIDEGDFATATELAQVKAGLEALLNQRISDLTAAYQAADQALKAEILGQIATTLSQLEDTLKSYVDGKISDLLNNQIKNLQDQVSALSKQISDAAQKADDAFTLAQNNAALITQLSADLADLQAQYGELSGELGQLQLEVTALEEKYGEVIETLNGVNDQLSELAEQYATLSDDYETFKADYAAYVEATYIALNGIREQLENFHNEVTDMYYRLMQKMAKYVSGITLNQVHNAIFGSINLPIDVQSNILTNYYAMSDHNVMFPGSSAWEYTTNEGIFNDELSEELEAIDAPTMQVMSADVKQLDALGKLYLTVDPAERDFEGLRLSIVNSRDEQVLDELKLEKSDHLLTMGNTRSEHTSGLYEAVATPRYTELNEEIAKTSIKIEDGLLTEFKDAIKNHTKSDFVDLAKVIYRQFSQDIPAYCVKCEWDDTELDETGTEVVATKSVRSDYKMAVTTFRPLSYRSAWGFGTEAQLPTPTMGYIKDIINRAFESIHSRLQLGLDGITYTDIEIELNLNISIDPDTKIDINLGGSPVYDKDGNLIGYLGDEANITLGYTPDGQQVVGPNGDALNSLVDQIIKAIESSIEGDADTEGIAKQIADQVNAEMEKMVKDINSQLEGVQSKIDNTLASIKDRIDKELNGRFGRLSENLLDLYNSLATRVNRFLKNPNAYLQVMMAYMGQDGQIHHLSNDRYDATPLQVGNNMELFATSHNAEIIVPSFKKYVAVVAAYDANGNKSVSAAKQANETEYFNEILPGDYQRIYLDGSKLRKGYTYKIFYSSVDYRGYTSSQVYYVRAY